SQPAPMNDERFMSTNHAAVQLSIRAEGGSPDWPVVPMRGGTRVRGAVSPHALIPAPCFQWLAQHVPNLSSETPNLLLSAYMNSTRIRQLAALAKGIGVIADRAIVAGSRCSLLFGSFGCSINSEIASRLAKVRQRVASINGCRAVSPGSGSSHLGPGRQC